MSKNAFIKELERIVIETKDDGTQTTRLPNNEEMMSKINDIIKQVNYLTRTRPSEPLRGVGTRLR